MIQYILIGIFAFLAGFFYAESKKTFKKKSFNGKRISEDAERLKKEYENFLNYDGSEQI